jgi:hypothetical protein
MENNGYANLHSPDLSEIGGAKPHTQWVCYLRMWTDEEKVYVDEKILEIEKEQPNAPGQVPFIKLKQILKYLSSSNRARAGVDELPDDKPLKSDVGEVVKDIVVVQEDASVFPKVASKGLIAIERLPLADQEAVSQGTQPSAKEQPPAKEDVIPSGEKMVTRRSLRNPTTIKMKKKL